MTRQTSRSAFSWEDRQLLTLTQKAMAAGLKAAGVEARRDIKAMLGGAAGSAPGSTPGRVSGDLVRAVMMRSKTKAGRFVALDVGVLRPNRYDRGYPGEAYAKALRLARGYTGRDRRGRVYRQAGRPFIDRWLEQNRSRIAATVENTASTWMPKARP